MKSNRISGYKYCFVPMCTNTSKSTPNKWFFPVPKNENVRKVWCKRIKRSQLKKHKLSAISTLFCCEDHFDLEEDTNNFIEYKIMSKQEGRHVSLRLKKGAVPHRFDCQKGNKRPAPLRTAALKRQRLETVRQALVEAADREKAQHIEETNKLSNKDDENDPSTSSTINTNNNMSCDRSIQVKHRVNYRSKGINVKIGAPRKDIALSPILESCNIMSSPINLHTPGINREFFPCKSVDSVTSQSSVIHIDEPRSSFETICAQNESDKQFKNLMCSGTLTAIKREPKMMLGLSQKSFHIIKLLHESIPVPTIDILIALKKINLNDSFSILAIHFGLTQSTVRSIFAKTIPLLAEKIKQLIIWPERSKILKNLPLSLRAKYGNIVSIVDFLDIEIVIPSDAVHQSLTWCEYRKCNTLKYLISCTPDGLINFVSEGFGGGALDSVIIENSNYLGYLPTNSAVMADGDVKGLSERKNCSLIHTPSVFKSLRTSEHCVINRLREFHMLSPHACVDQTLIPIIDEVILVACGIINIQNILLEV